MNEISLSPHLACTCHWPISKAYKNSSQFWICLFSTKSRETHHKISRYYYENNLKWSESSFTRQMSRPKSRQGQGGGSEQTNLSSPPCGKQIENKIVLSVNNGPNIPLALTKILIDPKGILWWTYIVCYNNQFFYKQKNFRALRTLSSSILFYFNTPHFRHVAFF